MQGSNWLQRLADDAELVSEPLPGVPIVEVMGQRRVLIERHQGIREFSRERICVKVRFGAVCIIGCALELTQMNCQQVVISGRIDCVQLLRRNV